MLRYQFWGFGLFTFALYAKNLVQGGDASSVALGLSGGGGLIGGALGLVLAHVVLTLPYVLRTVSATLHGVNRALEESAAILGANRWRTFRHVTLPLILPGLIAGATFSLIISFDEFTVALFLTGPGLMTLPLEIYNYTEFTIDPTIAAISTVLIVISVAVIMAIERFLGFEKHFKI